ncbi:MAG TPA: 50S ribosomal protein L3 [Gemmatimonadaceae bacterium]|nr:50S ribosomal protein L3 [Gemmatimonadaceae bacterium]
MSIGIIGRKLGMTQIFNEQGQQIPVTVIEAEPNPVVAMEKSEQGVPVAQLGHGAQRLAREADGKRTPRGRRAASPAIGHAKKAGLDAPPRVLRGFRLDDNDEGVKADYKVGDVVKVDIFAPGEIVKVTGTTKGRGFQGVVKRHGFGGGPNTHGNTRHRKPGSIGPGTDPSRVIKGKKMPGHYGAERHTQIGLRVERVDTDKNLIYVRGAVAGPKNGIVLVRKQAAK